MGKALVFRGTKVKTIGGLTKDKLMRNKRGKLVSKKASTSGKRAYKNIKDWTSSLVAARKALQVTGFVAVNGKTHQGKALYAKSKALHAGSATEQAHEWLCESVASRPLWL